mgnify:FL=1
MTNPVIPFFRNIAYLWLALLFIFPASYTFARTLKIGEPAPNLIGINAKSKKQINLIRLMTSLQFKRDVKGNLVVGENGKYVTEFIENVVVLNFFQKTCLPCLREIPTFNRIARSFINDNVKFLYVNIDAGITRQNAKKFIKKNKIRIPVMLPNQKEAMRQYDAYRLPRLVVIDKNKKTASIMEGFDGDLTFKLTKIIRDLLDE